MSQPKILTPSLLAVSAEAAAAAPKPLPPVPTASWEAVRKLREANPAVDYRPYPHAPTYIVGNDGSIRNTIYVCRYGIKLLDSPRKSKHNTGRNGYPTVSVNGKNTDVHKMVLETYIGPRPLNHQAAHYDNNKTNASISNLRWATPKENIADKKRHGTWQSGDKANNVKLSDATVVVILRLSSLGKSSQELASDFKVSLGHIQNILKGKSRKDAYQTYQKSLK